MAKLFLLRHAKSQWNLDNRFAGWVDNPLSKEGRLQAQEAGKRLMAEKIDIAYTSPLMRNMETTARVFETISEIRYPLFLHLDGGRMQSWGNFTTTDQKSVPVYVSEKLNERYYGSIQGLDKAETIKKYGEQLVHLWRRGYSDKPPGGESLKDTYKRAVPFFKKYIEKDLILGKNVLVVASHNSLRALVKYMEAISDKDITNVELPFGALTEYEFNGKYQKLQ